MLNRKNTNQSSSCLLVFFGKHVRVKLNIFYLELAVVSTSDQNIQFFLLSFLLKLCFYFNHFLPAGKAAATLYPAVKSI